MFGFVIGLVCATICCIVEKFNFFSHIGNCERIMYYSKFDKALISYKILK